MGLILGVHARLLDTAAALSLYSATLGLNHSSMDILSKRRQDITAADIYALCKRRVREDELLEFKRPECSDDKILKEVVAFANSFGGALVLGIAEGAERDAADQLCPLENCAAKASRFIDMISDKVDPRLPSCEIFHVDLDAETADADDITWKEGIGFVVFRIPERSRWAPHAIKFNSQRFSSPRRYGSTSRVMSMREIQDLTLNTERGMRRLERKLESRQECFVNSFHRDRPYADPSHLKGVCGENAFGFRITAAPVDPHLGLIQVYASRESLVAGLQRLDVTLTAASAGVELLARNGPRGHNPTTGTVGGALFRDKMPRHLGREWGPILRGARSTTYDRGESKPIVPMALELHDEGLVELTYAHVGPSLASRHEKECYSEDFLIATAHVICWVEALRQTAGWGRVEYVLDIQLYVTHGSLQVMAGAPSERRGVDYIRSLAAPGVRLPRLSFHDVTDGAALLTVLERYLCHAAGIHFQQRDEVDYDIEYKLV